MFMALSLRTMLLIRAICAVLDGVTVAGHVDAMPSCDGVGTLGEEIYV